MKFCCRFKTGKCKSLSNPQASENFAKDRKRKDRLTVHCKSCLKSYREENKSQRNEVIKLWRQANPEKMIAYRVKSSEKNKERMRLWRLKNPNSLLLKRYGITKDTYNAIFQAQNGCCAICSKHQSLLPRTLNVDHCHTSKKVRGLLCDKCNKAIGLLSDDVSLMNKAVEYLTGVQ